MKHFLVCFLVSLFLSSTYAQNITLNDLIKIRSLDQDDVKTFMKSKGFAYDGYTGKSDNYEYSLNFMSKNHKSVLIYQVRDSKKVSILFLTGENNYLNLKSIAKSNKYIKGGTFFTENLTCTEYKNRHYIISFCTSTEDIPNYRIQLEKIN